MPEETILGQSLDGGNNKGDDNSSDTAALTVDQLVGEGKQFKSLEEAVLGLAKKAVHADRFIETLKGEKQEAISELVKVQETSKTVKDVLDALQGSGVGILDSKDLTGDGDKGGEKPNLDPTKIEELIKTTVSSVLTKSKETDQISANVKKSWASLAEIYKSDDGAKKAVSLYIKDNPSRKAMVENLGKTDPVGLANLIRSNVEPPKPSVDSESHLTSLVLGENEILDGSQLTREHFKKMRKENPKMYWSPKVQTYLHKNWDKIK